MDENDLLWMHAIVALNQCSDCDPDPKDLANLLRAGAPIPAFARNALADMLDPPTDAAHVETMLIAQPTRTRPKAAVFERKEWASDIYGSERVGGRAEEDALESARKVLACNDKSNFHAMRRAIERRRQQIDDWFWRCWNGR
jgi:hypothetical protein